MDDGRRPHLARAQASEAVAAAAAAAATVLAHIVRYYVHMPSDQKPTHADVLNALATLRAAGAKQMSADGVVVVMLPVNPMPEEGVVERIFGALLIREEEGGPDAA